MAYLCSGTTAVSCPFVGWGDGRCSAATRHRPNTKVSKAGASRNPLPGLRRGPSCLIEAAAVSQAGYDANGSARSVIAAVPQGGNEILGLLPTWVDHISSPNNTYVKHLVRLRQSAKARKAAASVVVVGTIPLREICESVEMDQILIDVLLLREDAQTPDGVASLSRRIVQVNSAAMSKLSGLDSPPDAVGVLSFPSTFTAFEHYYYEDAASSIARMQKWCSSPRRILVLDSIQDPGNVGTLLRTAAAFAWDGVFLLHGCCDPFNDKALRAARGAVFRVPIATGEWNHVREFALTNKLKLYAGDPEPDAASWMERYGPRSSFSENIMEGPKLSLSDGEGLCLVLGSEGQGLSEDVSKDCSRIGIPMAGKFESLNVAVAGGILMFLLN